MRKVFLDTNVVIDFLARRVDFFEDSAEILTLAKQGSFLVYASSLTFSTASYIMKRHHVGTAVEVRDVIAKFIKNCKVTAVDGQSVEYATTGAFDDFEDAIQYESACKAQCDCIITRNSHDFSASEIPVYEPKAFLELFEDDNQNGEQEET